MAFVLNQSYCYGIRKIEYHAKLYPDVYYPFIRYWRVWNYPTTGMYLQFTQDEIVRYMDVRLNVKKYYATHKEALAYIKRVHKSTPRWKRKYCQGLLKNKDTRLRFCEFEEL